MKKFIHIFLIIIFVICTIATNAQIGVKQDKAIIDTIPVKSNSIISNDITDLQQDITKIEKQNKPMADTMSNKRKILLDNFLNGKIDIVKEVMFYFREEINNDKYITLLTDEKCLLYFWTKEYNLLLLELKIPDNICYHWQGYSPIIVYKKDNLYKEIEKRTIENYNEIEQQILSSKLTNEQKDFLILNLQSLIIEGDQKFISPKSLNKKSIEFLNNYPETIYENIIKYRKFTNIPSDWSYAANGFLGFGINNNELKKYFTNSFLYGCLVDINYKDFSFYLNTLQGKCKTKQNINYDTIAIWEKNSKAYFGMLEFSLGYSVFKDRYFKLAPFAGVSTMSFNQGDYSQENFYTKLAYTTTYTFGLNADINIKIFSKNSFVSLYDKEKTFIRLRLAYNKPQFHKRYNKYDGDVIYLGVGFGISSVKKKKRLQ